MKQRRMKTRINAVVLVVLFAAPAPVLAQTAADEREALAVVHALFGAMRTRDSAAVRALFHPSARLVTVGEREGEPFIRMTGVDGFIRAIGSGDEVWDERLYDTEIRVDGNLAAIWTGYSFYADGEFSHCGVDAFQLARTADGWKITQIADTRRREGCQGAADS